MKILGIYYGHESNAAIIENGKVLSAISEERLNRKKFYRGFPFLSIKAVFDYTGLSPQNIDIVAVVGFNAHDETLGGNLKEFYARINQEAPWYAKALSLPFSVFDNLFCLTIRRKIAKRMVINVVKKLGFSFKQIRFIDHHLAHAAGAFFLSGFNEALVFTIDGKGDHIAHRTYLSRQNKFEKLYETKDSDSVGHFYTCITAYLGFKRLHHEGKITGLAAYGDFEKVKDIPSPIGLANNSTTLRNLLFPEKDLSNIYRIYFKLLTTNPKFFWRMITTTSAIIPWYSQYLFEEYFKSKFNGTPREHVAAFAQRHLENTVVKLVHEQTQKYKIPYVCLSGGTFGNVRLNQKIAELEGVKNVYIQPAMGDGGLAVGAALWEYWRNQEKWSHNFMPQAYLGTNLIEDEIVATLRKYNLPYKKVENIEEKIADVLAKGKIVGRAVGAMEWGPRALGNRSILVSAKDTNINQILNKRLKRTEFMPFAPIIMEEYASQYLENYDSSHLAARFMTITYNVAKAKIPIIPAVVHVDGTARPQVVRKEDNISLYKVLFAYHKLTGVPVLINTSFNMHEEPIVCTPDDAVRAYLQGAVDILAIGNYWVEVS